MNLVFEFPRFHTNNAGMVKALCSEGHEVTFSVVRISPIEDYSTIKPIHQKQCRISKILCNLFPQNPAVMPLYFPSIFSYFTFLKNLQIDAAIIRSPFRVISLFALLYCLVHRKKIVFYTQHIVTYQNNSIKWLLRYAIAKVCNAKWICPLCFKDSSFQVHVPFLVEDEEIGSAKIREKPSKVLRLLLVAKAVPRKNIKLVIRTLHQLLERGLQVNLCLVTEVTTKAHRLHLEEILSCVSELRVSKHLQILQNVRYAEMPDIYRQNDIFILSSFNEPASVSIIEAMVYGCVAISSEQNGTATYIDNGQNGFIFDPNDMDQLVQIIETLSVPQFYESIRLNSLQKSIQATSRKTFLNSFYDAIY